MKESAACALHNIADVDENRSGAPTSRSLTRHRAGLARCTATTPPSLRAPLLPGSTASSGHAQPCAAFRNPLRMRCAIWSRYNATALQQIWSRYNATTLQQIWSRYNATALQQIWSRYNATTLQQIWSRCNATTLQQIWSRYNMRRGCCGKARAAQGVHHAERRPPAPRLAHHRRLRLSPHRAGTRARLHRDW